MLTVGNLLFLGGSFVVCSWLTRTSGHCVAASKPEQSCLCVCVCLAKLLAAQPLGHSIKQGTQIAPPDCVCVPCRLGLAARVEGACRWRVRGV